MSAKAQIILRLSGDGRGLEAQMPSGHSIALPADERAGRLLERLLLAQEATAAHGVGTAASPLQHTIDRWLLGAKPQKYDEKGRKEMPPVTLEMLGLGQKEPAGCE